jgi:polyisoprenyl-teichoic acid--peptidoglycan teichoic acid transferase
VQTRIPPTTALDRLEQLDRRWVPRAIRPVRYGELGWAVIAPGITTARRFRLLGWVLAALGVVLPLAVVVWLLVERNAVVGLVLSERFLFVAMTAAAAVVLARLVAVTEVALSLRRAGRRLGGETFVAYSVVLLLAVPVAWGVMRAEQARDLVNSVFSGGSSEPLFAAPSQVSSPKGITNVLLLGGDAGPGRWGLRTDSMILVSIDKASGRTALISIPRNLTRLQFPPGSPMNQRYPNGFDDIANAVYPRVTTSAELMEAYERSGLQPEAAALAEGIGYSLGVPIDDYVLVNMQGFLELIDAVGGVTVDVEGTVPLPPTLPGGKRPIPESVGPGMVAMDGTLAIAYARSRYADSDYQRMQRQRQLLSALSQQVSVTDAARRFPSISSALNDMLRTSLTPGEFADLVDALGGDGSVTESVGLAPPIVQPGNPDYAEISRIVAEVQRAIVSGEPSPYSEP